MSNYTDALSRAHTAIAQVLKSADVGTAAEPRRVKLIDAAVEHAVAWAEIQAPREGEWGGSSAPAAVEEQEEQQRVARLGAHAASRLPEIVKALDSLGCEMYDLIQRLTSVVHPNKYPSSALPGCMSCARKEGGEGRQIGGHFAAVYEKSKASGLCRWCWDHDQATGELPPVKACHIYHSQGPRAAGIWLAKWQRKAS